MEYCATFGRCFAIHVQIHFFACEWLSDILCRPRLLFARQELIRAATATEKLELVGSVRLVVRDYTLLAQSHSRDTLAEVRASVSDIRKLLAVRHSHRPLSFLGRPDHIPAVRSSRSIRCIGLGRAAESRGTRFFAFRSGSRQPAPHTCTGYRIVPGTMRSVVLPQISAGVHNRNQ